MEVSQNESLLNIVGKNFYASELLDRYGIDYCCHGSLTLQQACELKNIDINLIIAELLNIPDEEDEASVAFSNWPLDMLMDYLIRKHTLYVTNDIPEIAQLLSDILSDHTPELDKIKAIQRIIEQTKQDLTKHIEKEEAYVFSYIRNMVNPKAEIPKPKKTLQSLITDYYHDHQKEGKRFKEIRAITNDYSVPKKATTTFAKLYQKLEDLERDLHRHIHLENNILYPKALDLEKRIYETAE